ncbi:uncharacterized protein ABIB90_007149 [Bradyrhizobium sp. JR4.1]|uniref:cyclophane-forming radical SAM/SPASM peptide maturase GrrM/OscB n=1 Tax=Bradyrhizobium sp. JR4.1 TaxID=3156372 RepID=UPI003396726A
MTPEELVGRTRLLILQPTPFCNIDCSYCYLPARNDRHRMSFETIEAAVRFVFDNKLNAPDLTVVWHAGEPLVLPVHWYRQAFAAASRGAPAVTMLPHAFQTNAMLIDDEWCDFFLEHSVRLGVSIDGPDWLHDARRRTRAGQGTHARVMKGVELLQRRGVPFHVICVVGEKTLAAADALVEFFLNHGIHDVGFNIEEIEGANRRSTLQTSDVSARFEQFVKRLLKVARESRCPFIIREQRELLALMQSSMFGRLLHNSQNEPFAFISVSARGAVFTFSPELAGLQSPQYGDFSIGQLPEINLPEVLSAPQFRAMLSDIEVGVSECRDSCKYFDLCLGGAPVNKLSEHGDFKRSETLHCKLYHQTFAEAVLLDLEQSLRLRTQMPANCR